MEDCLFCRIVAGEIPAEVVHMTERTVAFRDINAQAPTHVLVVPKAHHANAAELAAADPVAWGALVTAPGAGAGAGGGGADPRGVAPPAPPPPAGGPPPPGPAAPAGPPPRAGPAPRRGTPTTAWSSTPAPGWARPSSTPTSTCSRAGR